MKSLDISRCHKFQVTHSVNTNVPTEITCIDAMQLLTASTNSSEINYRLLDSSFVSATVFTGNTAATPVPSYSPPDV